MRLRYEGRRDALLEALARWAPDCVPGDGAAGLYELVALPDGVEEAGLVAAAAERGVGVEGISLHRFTGGGPPALVLGFGNLPEPAIEHGVRLLGEALGECAR
jgi:GntR family transcriptional regulator/MocR family aminotransferase